MKTGGGREYHDNCRCLGIEVARPEDLPQINRDLWDLWVDATFAEPSTKGQLAAWKTALATRSEKTKFLAELPVVPGIRIPEYRNGGKRLVNGVEEYLPDLDSMPGHVLYGWRSENIPQEFVLDKTLGGHTAQSLKQGKTRFPQSWSDQRIVNAFVGLLETGEIVVDNDKRMIEEEVDGIIIRVKYFVADRKGQGVFGYPLPTPDSGTSNVKRNGRVRWH